MSCYLQPSEVKLGHKTYKTPLLTDRCHRFIEPASAYVRYLATVRKLRENSVQKYAELLLHFCQYLQRKIDSTKSSPEASLGKVATVSDALLHVRNSHLEDWLNQQDDAKNAVDTQNHRLDAVFNFYVWMEVSGLVKYAVRVPGINDQVAFTPWLRSKPASRRSAGRHRASTYGIVSDLRRKVDAVDMLPTPTTAEMTELYAACTRLFGKAASDRNVCVR